MVNVNAAKLKRHLKTVKPFIPGVLPCEMMC